MIDHAEIEESNGWRVVIYRTDGTYVNDGCCGGLNETARVVKVNDNYVVVDYESCGSRRVYFDEHGHVIKTESR